MGMELRDEDPYLKSVVLGDLQVRPDHCENGGWADEAGCSHEKWSCMLSDGSTRGRV